MSRAELRVVPLVPFSAVRARRVEVDNVGPSWGALLVAYADELRARDSTPQALSGRLAHVRRLAREVGGSPASVTLGDLERFLTRPEWALNTRKAHRASVVSLFSWAHERQLVASNPADSLLNAAGLDALATAADDGDPSSGDGSEEAIRVTPKSDEVAESWQRGKRAPGETEHPARSWARATGYPCPGTGRVPVGVVEAWHAAGRPRVEPGHGLPRSWSRMVDAYVRELRAQHTRASTINLKLSHLRRFAADLDESPESVTRDNLIGYLAEPSWSPEYRRSVRSGLVTFFRWAHETDRLASNPAARVPSVRVPGGVPRPAPETMIRDAINGARPDVRLMILLGALAGLRRGEIHGLSVEDVTADGLHVVGKGGRSRLVPVHPVLVGEVAAYCETRGITSGRLFLNPVTGEPYTLDYLGVLIGKRMPPGWSAHKLRHRFASRSYAGQYNLRAVQELLGHASPSVTARYVAVPETALTDAVLAVPPIPGIETMTPRTRSTRETVTLDPLR